MSSLVVDILLSAVITAVVLALNCLGYCIRLVFHSGKAEINPKALVVVITGCDSGFGEASALRLSRLGFRVVAGCLTEVGAQRIRDNVSLAIVCDVTKEKDVTALVNATQQLVESLNGHLWAVINNAGIASGGPLDWVPVAEYRRIMEVNFFGLVGVTKAMLPLLKQCGNSRIINLSSIAGILGSPNLSAYTCSKHAVEGFMKSLKDELRPWHIHVSNINPGFMRTPIIEGASEKNLKAFEAIPEHVKSQYLDPRPQFSEMERVMNQLAEDPSCVVEAIENAVTALRPSMWYFPGRGASISRFFPLASSENIEYFLSLLIGGTVHTPMPEILKKRRSPGKM